MKKSVKLLSCIFVLSTIFLSSCSDVPYSSMTEVLESTTSSENIAEDYNKLLSPQNIIFDSENYVLKWDSVSGADHYEINVNGSVIKTARPIVNNTYTFKESVFENTSDTEFLISVRAINEDGTIKSNYSSYLYDTSSSSSASLLSYSFNADNTTIAITGFSGSLDFSGDTLEIPSTITINKRQYTVTSIAEKAFASNKNVKHFILPSTILEIQDNAFSGASMESITLNEGLVKIGNQSFYQTRKLIEISIPSTVKEIGNKAFYQTNIGSKNDGLITFAGTPSIETIGDGAFGLTYFASFEFPASIKNLGKELFKQSSVTSITFADGFNLKEFSESCFSELKLLNEFKIPSSIEVLGESCFSGSTKLKKITYSNDSNLKVISPSSFVKCSGLKYFGVEYEGLDDEIKANDQKVTDKELTNYPVKVSISHNIERIEKNAFNALKIVDLDFTNANNLKFIGESSFAKNALLTSVTFNDALTYIAKGAFIDNTNLETINFNDSTNIEFIESTSFKNSSFIKAKEGERIILGKVLYQASSTDMSATEINDLDNLYGISNGIFKGSNIERVTLPETLRYIGDEAFYKCDALTSIDIPSSVTTIGDSAFEGCKNVATLSLGNVDSSNLSKIGSKAFKGVSKVNEIVLPNNVNEISLEAFSGCTSLVSFNISNSSKLEIIADKAFYGTTNLESINIPNGVISIGESAFYNTKAMTNIDISLSDSKLESVGNSAFENSKITHINLPATLILLDEEAFKGCTSLSSVIFAEEAFKNSDNPAILKSTFENCKELHYIKLPNFITSIEEDAFYRASLKDGIDSVAESIHNNAFRNSSFEDSFDDGFVKIGSVLLRYTGDKVVLDASDLQGITILSANVFASSNIESISIPSSVEEIRASAFENCQSLKSVNIASDAALSIIGENAFKDCINLENITLSSNIETIAPYAFYRCLSLRSVEINSDKITTISESCFANCNSLSSVKLSDSISSIAPYAFYQTGLTSITFPKQISEIGDYAFACIGKAENALLDPSNWKVTPCLSSITFDLSSPLKQIGKYAFANNITKSIALPSCEGLYLDEYCFANSSELEVFKVEDGAIVTVGIISGANKLKELELSSENSVLSLFGGQISMVPQTLKSIVIAEGSTFVTDYAFAGLGTVESITIPSSVTKIGDYAFYGCRSISSINLTNITTIGNNAFNGCVKLTNITISSKMDYIGDKAFYSTGYLNNSTDEFVIVDGILLEYKGNETNVILPASVKVIAGGAFSGNHDVESIVLGKNTNLICNGAFDSCTNLKKITMSYEGLVEVELKTLDTLSSSLEIEVDKKYLSLYYQDINWSLYEDYLPKQ